MSFSDSHSSSNDEITETGTSNSENLVELNRSSILKEEVLYKKQKRRIYCLSVTLVISVAIIIFLFFYIFNQTFLISHHIEQISTNIQRKTREYRFKHQNNGDDLLVETSFIPVSKKPKDDRSDIIEEPGTHQFVTPSEGQSIVGTYKRDWNSPNYKNLYEATLDLYCCPFNQVRRAGVQFKMCRFVLKGTIIQLDGDDEKHARKLLYRDITRLSFTGVGSGGRNVCGSSEIIQYDLLHITLIKNPPYICYGNCVRGSYSYFLLKNPQSVYGYQQFLAQSQQWEDRLARKGKGRTGPPTVEEAEYLLQKNFDEESEKCQNEKIVLEYNPLENDILLDPIHDFTHRVMMNFCAKSSYLEGDERYYNICMEDYEFVKCRFNIIGVKKVGEAVVEGYLIRTPDQRSNEESEEEDSDDDDDDDDFYKDIFDKDDEDDDPF